MSLYEEKNLDRQTQREDSHVKTEAGTGVMPPRAKEYLGLPEAGRGREGPFPGGFGGAWPYTTLVLDF